MLYGMDFNNGGQVILPVFIRVTDLNYWIKLLSCIIEANGGILDYPI